MSLITTIFDDVKNIFKKLFGMEPEIAQLVTATITVIAPLVETILVLSGAEAALSEIQIVISQVESDLAAVTALVKSSGVTVTLSSVLNAVIANLQSLLTAGDIKDPVTLAKVTAFITTIVTEIETILSAINPPKASA